MGHGSTAGPRRTGLGSHGGPASWASQLCRPRGPGSAQSTARSPSNGTTWVKLGVSSPERQPSAGPRHLSTSQKEGRRDWASLRVLPPARPPGSAPCPRPLKPLVLFSLHHDHSFPVAVNSISCSRRLFPCESCQTPSRQSEASSKEALYQHSPRAVPAGPRGRQQHEHRTEPGRGLALPHRRLFWHTREGRDLG